MGLADIREETKIVLYYFSKSPIPRYLELQASEPFELDVSNVHPNGDGLNPNYVSLDVTCKLSSIYIKSEILSKAKVMVHFFGDDGYKRLSFDVSNINHIETVNGFVFSPGLIGIGVEVTGLIAKPAVTLYFEELNFVS